jgi:hypothetical protein
MNDRNIKKEARKPAKNGGSSSAQSYIAWIADLKRRYRATQIKAAIAVNSALIEFYWNLGKDISERYAKSQLGNEFYRRLSADLKTDSPNAGGLSPTNLKYSGYFFKLYSRLISGLQLADPGSTTAFWRNTILRNWACQWA